MLLESLLETRYDLLRNDLFKNDSLASSEKLVTKIKKLTHFVYLAEWYLV